tara:strand:+ start:1771 stop:2718 length:948 start_codon:yes stop_codon:yes gene_type:complete
MRISVRLEGGLGDHLCANRFIPAIREEYPEALITAYSDTEGNSFQKECLDVLYPRFYDSIKIIPRKKYKEFWIDSQFGTESYIGALENVPDEFRDEMESYDRFYDLHIDSLKWINYDFDWYRYFRFFPPPILKRNKNKTPYIIFQLHVSRSGDKGETHHLEDWYVDGLINSLSREFKCKIIATSELAETYQRLNGNPNVEIIVGEVEEIINEIKDASLFIGIDSGFRFIGHCFGIPTITYGIYYNQPHESAPFHQVRWSIFPEQCFPIHYNYKKVVSLALKVMDNKICSFFPKVSDLNSELVMRNYAINKDKSIS